MARGLDATLAELNLSFVPDTCILDITHIDHCPVVKRQMSVCNASVDPSLGNITPPHQLSGAIHERCEASCSPNIRE